jgi:hypothetical protein
VDDASTPPLSLSLFPLSPLLLLPLTLPLPRSDPPADDDALNTPKPLVTQTTSSKEEQLRRDDAKASTHHAATPPPSLHDAKPPLTAGKPRRPSLFSLPMSPTQTWRRRRPQAARSASNGRMAHAGYVGCACPGPPQAPASFLFIFHRHLENPLGRPISVHLAWPKPSRPNAAFKILKIC